MSPAILLIEDDPDLARGVRFNLEQEGHRVVHADTGSQALEALGKEHGFALVLLDLNLPDMDGLDILKSLRENDETVPVICLTARGQETDVVMGLGLGADDYVTKPFGVAVLLARMDAVLRRFEPKGENGEKIQLGGATIDLEAHKARHADREEDLTPIEMDLLKFLWQHRGRAVDRQRLLRELWGLQPRHTTRTLDNHVARLRRKIEADPSHPRFLVTVHGIGYRLEAIGTTS